MPISPINGADFPSGELRRRQSRFEQRYPCFKIDDQGQEQPITQRDIEMALSALQDSDDEFLSVLARRSTN